MKAKKSKSEAQSLDIKEQTVSEPAPVLEEVIGGDFHPERLSKAPDYDKPLPPKKKYLSVLDRLGPNALDFAKDAPEELVAARLKLSDMIARCNADPAIMPIWIEEKIDRWMGAAMWERVRGEDIENRKLTDGQVENLETDMLREGGWIENGENIKFTHAGQVLDGQGRLATLLLAARKNPDVFFISDVRFRVKREAFSTIDTGKKRTSADILGMSKISNGYLVGAMARLWSAYHANMMRSQPKVSNSQVLEIVTQEKELFVKAARIGQMTKDTIPIPGAVLAFACAIGLRSNEKKTMAFFNQLNSGLDMQEGNPAWVLTRVARNKGGMSRNSSFRIEMAALLIKALNAHFLNQKIDVLRWGRSEPFPLFVGDKNRPKLTLPGKASTEPAMTAPADADNLMGSLL